MRLNRPADVDAGCASGATTIASTVPLGAALRAKVWSEATFPVRGVELGQEGGLRRDGLAVPVDEAAEDAAEEEAVAVEGQGAHVFGEVGVAWPCTATCSRARRCGWSGSFLTMGGVPAVPLNGLDEYSG